MSHPNPYHKWANAFGMNLIKEVEIKIGPQTVHRMTGIDAKLVRIRELFDELDDVHDVFEETKYYNIGDNYICYKECSEYGTFIGICENTGKNVFKLFLNNLVDEKGEAFITTFYNTQTNTGLYEKHFSNRTEHYINGVYHSSGYSDEIMTIIRNNTRIVLEDMTYPTLYEFIMNRYETVILLPKNEMNIIKFDLVVLV